MEKSDPRSSSALSGLSGIIGRYISLLVEDTRLNLAEKITRLLSATAVCSGLLVCSVVALIFVSLGVSVAIGRQLGNMWAFLIIAGFYIIVAIVLFTCKRVLIVNPIARFISRLLVPAPVKPTESQDDKPTTVS